MRTNGSIVDFDLWLRETAIAEQGRILLVVSSEGQEVVDIGDFAEMRTNGVEEDEL